VPRLTHVETATASTRSSHIYDAIAYPCLPLVPRIYVGQRHTTPAVSYTTPVLLSLLL